MRVGTHALFALAIGCCGHAAVAAESPAEATYRRSEAERLGAITRQLELNNWLIWQSGYGTWDASPFEPWPRVPREPWANLRPRPVDQPTGHQSLQTGPNRWIYRPIYADQLPRATGAIVEGKEATEGATRRVEPPGPSDRSGPPPANPAPRDAIPRAGPRAF